MEQSETRTVQSPGDSFQGSDEQQRNEQEQPRHRALDLFDSSFRLDLPPQDHKSRSSSPPVASEQDGPHVIARSGYLSRDGVLRVTRNARVQAQGSRIDTLDVAALAARK
ncbi:hypothetical protein K0M31_005897 [Melipona bicolor]|uniref:Uncharacterized protein n=1 Tax=Melipona bicolor TaxID=60889 RepID=A0AA40FUM6_9HYME|nr:hypothetical protein K0M31_005897 [Melipona bicolor]